MEKALSRALLILYVLALIWVVLFKLSFNLSTLFEHQTGLNLIPFGASASMNGGTNFREILLNCLVFIPFGLLLSVNFKKIGFRQKLLTVLAFSLAAETIQYVFAIGASDITDVITNTLGGFLGLAAYEAGRRAGDENRLDRTVISISVALFLLFATSVASMVFRRLTTPDHRERGSQLPSPPLR